MQNTHLSTCLLTKIIIFVRRLLTPKALFLRQRNFLPKHGKNGNLWNWIILLAGFGQSKTGCRAHCYKAKKIMVQLITFHSMSLTEYKSRDKFIILTINNIIANKEVIWLQAFHRRYFLVSADISTRLKLICCYWKLELLGKSVVFVVAGVWVWGGGVRLGVLVHSLLHLGDQCGGFVGERVVWVLQIVLSVVHVRSAGQPQSLEN